MKRVHSAIFKILLWIIFKISGGSDQFASEILQISFVLLSQQSSVLSGCFPVFLG